MRTDGLFHTPTPGAPVHCYVLMISNLTHARVSHMLTRNHGYKTGQKHQNRSQKSKMLRRLALVLVAPVLVSSLPPPPPPSRCEDSCVLVFGDGNKHRSIDVSADGECDDGGSGSEYHYCAPGTDCSDCYRGYSP